MSSGNAPLSGSTRKLIMSAVNLVTSVKQYLVEYLENFQSETLYLGFSGGLDSTVLLHLVASLRSELPVKNFVAVHINHQLSPNADAWQQHCEAVCADYQLPIQSFQVTVSKDKGSSLEANARVARYQKFTELLNVNDVMLLAQHQDDQAETLLLQALRGCGVAGLAAMPLCRTLGKGKAVRPLLNYTRAELLTYAKQHALLWVEDESNRVKDFARNYLRHDVMSQLTERWPSAAASFAQVAEHCAEAQTLLQEVAANDLDSLRLEEQAVIESYLDYQPTAKYFPICITKLLDLSVARQKNVLRYWLQQLGLTSPNRKKIENILQNICLAREDAQPLVTWKGVEVRRYKNALYAMSPLEKIDLQWHSEWHLQQSLVLPHKFGMLERRMLADILADDVETVTVAWRHGGERIQLAGRQHTHSVKHVLQNSEIPLWVRQRALLISLDNHVIKILCL